MSEVPMNDVERLTFEKSLLELLAMPVCSQLSLGQLYAVCCVQCNMKFPGDCNFPQKGMRNVISKVFWE